ncbi:hypothetical protein [Pedobacter sp. Leaf170]|uniref:hypothetical protein n=1 Tax=Pedobacter sp. Leaf170 TaxID=2876558 RepID=UPI001E440807|nr:hypothetical protein [Pedobacter sp. Leaf170]
MELVENKKCYCLPPEIVELFSKEINADEFETYINKQKDIYLGNLHKECFTKPKLKCGCEKCMVGALPFLKTVEAQISNLKLTFYSFLLVEELEEVINRFFDYFLDTATFFSFHRLGICHYSHFVRDALVLRAIKINTILRTKDIEVQNDIVREALTIDPIGTQISLIELNLGIDTIERKKQMNGFETYEYSSEYTDNFKDLERYAIKIGPLLNEVNKTTRSQELSKENFACFLEDPEGNVFNRLKSLYQNSRPREICLMLFALHELKLINQHPHQINKTRVYTALQSAFSNIGTRQAFNSSLNKIDKNHDKSAIRKHMEKING